MPKFHTQAPWEFLLSASSNILQSYEISRVGHAANLRKEIAALLDPWLDSVTCRRSPEVSSTTFHAQPPDLQPVPLMDMDFAVCCPLVRPRMVG